MRFAHLLFGSRTGAFGAGVLGAHAAERLAWKAQRAAWKAERAAWKAQRRALRAQRPLLWRAFSGLVWLAWLAFVMWTAFGFAFGGPEFRDDFMRTVQLAADFARRALEFVVANARSLFNGTFSGPQ
ncbi:MAG: hypothetical protein NTZ56_14595 [Acidobacteria bacterium]|nr:hypothetical protein [Acidobacteriota bacterium]